MDNSPLNLVNAEHTVFFLGAGFSIAATDGAAPAMPGYFSRLDPSIFPNLSKFIAKNVGELSHAELQRVISEIDQCDDLPFSRFCDPTDLPKINEELSDYTVERLAELDWDLEGWAPQFLALAGSESATIITTNYDTLAEEIMSSHSNATHCVPDATCFHCRMRSLISSCQACQIENLPGEMWRNNILKLHGSVAWYTCRSANCLHRNQTWTNCDCSASMNERCPRCGAKTKAVLVHPRMKKPYSDFNITRTVWEAAHLALTNATQFVLIGFSLPETDVAVRRLLRNGLRSDKLREVLVITPDPTPVISRLRSILPHLNNVSYHGLAAPKLGEWPTWFKSKVPATR